MTYNARNGDGRDDTARLPSRGARSTADLDASTAPARAQSATTPAIPEILEAAIDVLAETGFDGMTIDMVAARAKAGKATIYRRWPSKADLVLDAVAYMKADELDPGATSPTRAPCAATSSRMIRPRTIEEGRGNLRILAGPLRHARDLARTRRRRARGHHRPAGRR